MLVVSMSGISFQKKIKLRILVEGEAKQAFLEKEVAKVAPKAEGDSRSNC